MSTGLTWQTESISSKATLALGAVIGRKLRGHEVIELIGDLGSGKTTFVKGLAQGLGTTDQVHSPSFTLENIYRTPNLSLHHFDFYRLTEPGIIQDELIEVLEDPQAITIIEWSQAIKNVLPDRLTVQFNYSGETGRHIVLNYPAKLDYLIPDKDN